MYVPQLFEAPEEQGGLPGDYLGKVSFFAYALPGHGMFQSSPFVPSGLSGRPIEYPHSPDCGVDLTNIDHDHETESR